MSASSSGSSPLGGQGVLVKKPSGRGQGEQHHLHRANDTWRESDHGSTILLQCSDPTAVFTGIGCSSNMDTQSLCRW